MKNKFKIIIFLAGVLISKMLLAVDSNDLNSNLNDLAAQISKLNQDLDSKQQQKKRLDAALKDSQGAISQSEALLGQLRQQRDADLTQLKELMVAIPQITRATEQAKEYVTTAINTIYQQIRACQASEQTILSFDDSVTQQRKKAYLLELLKVEQTKYQQLNQKLASLQALNAKLQLEVNRLNDRLGETAGQHQQLLQQKDQKLQLAKSVQRQISQERNKLSNLKVRQAELNKLLQQLAAAEKRQKAQQLAAAKKAAATAAQAATHPSATKSVTGNGLSSGATQAPVLNQIDTSSEDNSPFLGRKLVKPVTGSISIAFGQMRDNVRNNGVLVSALENSPIYSISRGKVLFSGELPGFGQIVVIDNGDNYTSVYSGILAKVSKDNSVVPGQIIALSGDKRNQPMGGVYFELRHLGKPVNPTKLFN